MKAKTSGRRRSRRYSWLLIVKLSVVVLWGTAPSLSPRSLAASTREIRPQIAGPFTVPGGIAVDSGLDLWVVDREAGGVYEFNATGEFIGPKLGAKSEPEPVLLEEDLTYPDSLAIEKSTGDLYLTGTQTREFFSPRVEVFDGTGKHVSAWKDLTENTKGELLATSYGTPAHVAIDNTNGVSGGAVYVSHGSVDPGVEAKGDGLASGIERLDASGSAVAYDCTSCEYVKGNEIVGVPGENFEGLGIHRTPGDIVVDQTGNIYAVDTNYNAAKKQGAAVPEGAVVEFSPSGEFLQACTASENPGLGANHSGWGADPEELKGVAVDPLTGEVFLSITTQEDGAAIDVFDSSCHFVEQITETDVEVSTGVFEHRRLESSGEMRGEMAIDSSGALYFSDSVEKAVDVYGLKHTIPKVVLGAVSERTRTEATVDGSVDPEGAPLSECDFEYVTQASFEKEAFAKPDVAECQPGASEVVPDSEAQPVHAKLTALVSGATYQVRLVAATAGLLGGTAASEAIAFTAPAAPKIDSEGAKNISSLFAELSAQIEPLGADTSYRFEYDTREYAEGEGPHGVQTPVPDADVGPGGPTGGARVGVVQQIGGLRPDTTYYFRVVAESEIEGAVEVTMGAGGTFRTLPASGNGLPDGRAYELVTPANKGSAEDMFASPQNLNGNFENHDNGYPSDRGEEFLLETRAAFGEAGRSAASGENAYVLGRAASEKRWQAFPLAAQGFGVQDVNLAVFDPSDFSHVGVSDGVGSAPSSAGVSQLGLVGPPGGPYSTVVSEANVVRGNEVTLTLVGAARDLSRVVLQTSDPGLLATGQDEGSHALYEWSGGGECKQDSVDCPLVSVGPNGAPFQCGAWLGQSRIPGSMHGAVSADGSEVLFTAPDPYAGGPGCWDTGTTPQVHTPQLYVRRGGQTVEASAPEPGVDDPTCAQSEEACHPAVYAGAAEDGSSVYFVTESELTTEAVALKLHDPELYRYDTTSGERVRVSAGEPGSGAREPGGPGGEVWAVQAMSGDGAVVYFTAFNTLTPTAPALEEKLVGQVNLYRYDGKSNTTTYVTTVETRDYPDNNTGGWWTSQAEHTSIAPEPGLATNASWYTTPDGRYLLFATTSAVAPFDNTQSAPGDCPVYDSQHTVPTGRCGEVYRYDSAQPSSEGKAGVADNPACLSCDRSGEAPVSDAFFGATAAPLAPSAGPVRAMSDSGSCAFFDSGDPLVNQAQNRTLDVYEWEAPGSGDCRSEPGAGAPVCTQPNGCVYQIGSGGDRFPSYFLGTSADGANVFFGTHARLVPRDGDTAGDVYDARIGAGFPEEEKVGPCQADACASPPLGPVETTPGSFTFSGAGNVNEVTEGQAKAAPKGESRAKKLAAALRVCRQKPKGRRKKCEKNARKRFGKKATRSGRTRQSKTGGRAGR